MSAFLKHMLRCGQICDAGANTLTDRSVIAVSEYVLICLVIQLQQYP